MALAFSRGFPLRKSVQYSLDCVYVYIRAEISVSFIYSLIIKCIFEVGKGHMMPWVTGGNNYWLMSSAGNDSPSFVLYAKRQLHTSMY